MDVFSLKWLIEVFINLIVEPLFAGDSEIDQIFKIFQCFGTPTEKTWTGITKLPDYKQTFPQFRAKGLSTPCTNFDSLALDLLSKLVVLDPCKRISAKAALNHVQFIFLKIAILR